MAEATTGAEVETRQSARNQAMNDIAKRAHEEISGDLADFDENTGEIHGQKHQEQEEEQTKTEQQETAQIEAKTEQEQLETLIVDGQEIKVPHDKIVEAGRRTLQKESAADKRLQEATELWRQAQQYAAQVANNGLPQGVQQQTAPSGEDEQVQRQPQHIDVQTIARTIDQRVADQLYLRDANKAAQKFKEDFPEIAANPMLMSWAGQLENQRINEVMAVGGDLGDPFEAYRKHGESVREQMKSLGVTQGQKMETKQERKRDTVAVSGASIRTPMPQADKPKTQSQIIAEMRKARHQKID